MCLIQHCTPVPTPMPATGHSKVFGEYVNGWGACVSVSKIPGWWPRTQTLAPGLTATEEAALLGSDSSLNDSSTLSVHILSPSCFVVPPHPRAYLQISALPKACFERQVEPSIWIELNHWQSYVPESAGAGGRLWGRAQTFSP